MEYFHAGGGGSPYFSHRIRVRDVPNEIFEWCNNYDDEGRHFRRWHVEWGTVNIRDHDIIQFEWEQAALMFTLKFGEHIV